jgi:hypothetical protein
LDPVTLNIISAAQGFTNLLRLPRVLREAAVPLTFGIVCAGVSAGGYAWQLADQDLGSYFSAAAQVGVGVLVSLIIEGAVTGRDDEALVRGLRAGTLALTAAGTAASLLGLLVSADIATGVMFALTWGGLAAGVLGLLVFVGDPDTARRVAGAPALPTEGAPVPAAPPGADAPDAAERNDAQ